MSTRDVLLPPGATMRDWANDLMLTALLIVGTVGVLLPDLWLGAAVLPHVTLSLLMVMPLIVRRHAPMLALVGCTIAGILQLIFLDVPTPSLFAVPVVAYSVARWVPGYASRAVLLIGMVASVLGPARWLPYTSLLTFVLFFGGCLGAVISPYAVGRRLRELEKARRQQVAAAEERYRLLLAERDQQSRLVEASTRAEIARELHDIVAHSLSVMIVQAEGARAAAAKKPAVAEEALDTIAETGREALHEMRRIVGVLRSTPGATAADFAPAPSLDDLPDLVARTSDRATFDVNGTAQPLSKALELTVYRVVQEALTNFLKHAGPDAHAQVNLSYEPTQLVVDITDDGQGVDETSDGGGNGLRGMYERVTSMGGRLRAGTRPDAPGFRVTAWLPLRLAAPQYPAPGRTSA